MTASVPDSPLDVAAVRKLLGIRRAVPVSIDDMVRSLKVVFVPGTRETPRLAEFGRKLRAAFDELGIREITAAEALTTGGQLVEGVVPIYLGETQVDMLSLQQVPVQNLYSSQMVGIFDRPCPIDETADLQTRLDAIVEVMTTNLVTLCIFVTDASWVMCSMNGAVVRFANGESITRDFRQGVVSKVAARVVPPRVSDITCRYESFDPNDPALAEAVADFTTGAKAWAKSRLMEAHASVEALQFRSSLHRLLVTSFMDHRNGMSYGFLCRQLPTPVEPALTADEADSRLRDLPWDDEPLQQFDDRIYVRVHVGGGRYFVAVPEISVLCTRSGCKKDQLSPDRDLVRMTLSRKGVLLETPRGITKAEDCRPSYDTFTILGSALGNYFAASILERIRPGSRYARTLSTVGLGLSHWHGYLMPEQAPPGYVLHGVQNPSVCCSTPQSAIYALTGKIRALDLSLAADAEFLGDVHIEPHHGTNLCGVMSLNESAEFVYALNL